ncbi:hypothetical protein QBC47DRAFT_457782 [Echria macrotheca]|uniref:Uncharacterized protein n=1 Tax=Echria macrotheca TaxID=438768 RepID=A0AAJ0BLQ9_9PEZI|nr:hypothetical protein QBC47DRAFT_457782 [Echria macrotheca]
MAYAMPTWDVDIPTKRTLYYFDQRSSGVGEAESQSERRNAYRSTGQVSRPTSLSPRTLGHGSSKQCRLSLGWKDRKAVWVLFGGAKCDAQGLRHVVADRHSRRTTIPGPTVFALAVGDTRLYPTIAIPTPPNLGEQEENKPGRETVLRPEGAAGVARQSIDTSRRTPDVCLVAYGITRRGLQTNKPQTENPVKGNGEDELMGGGVMQLINLQTYRSPGPSSLPSFSRNDPWTRKLASATPYGNDQEKGTNVSLLAGAPRAQAVGFGLVVSRSRKKGTGLDHLSRDF